MIFYSVWSKRSFNREIKECLPKIRTNLKRLNTTVTMKILMQRSSAAEVISKIGSKVKVAGFVQAIRDLGNLVFIVLRDASGAVQIVISSDSEAFSVAKSITRESVVEVLGFVKQEPKAPNGLEIVVDNIVVLSLAANELPIPIFARDQNKVSEHLKLNWRWLDLRNPKNRLIFEVWTHMEHAFRDYLLREGFIQIHSPKLISAASESGSELFELKYFDRKAYLAQSPQFYKQMAMAAGFEKVFEIGPVFRANPSFTSRHDTEFTSYDIEISFISSHHELMELEEKLLQFMLEQIADKFGEAIESNFGRRLIAPSRPFPKLSLEEAKRLILKEGLASSEGEDLSNEEEITLCKLIREKENHEFVFITDYPHSVRPFYHMRQESNPNLTKSFDLLWDGLEITTGAQREHRYDILVSQLKEKKLSEEGIKFYLEFFRYGCPPHGGFAIGPTRMLMKIFNLNNVRKVTYIYRGPNRLEP